MFKTLREICEMIQIEKERKHPPKDMKLPSRLEGYTKFFYEIGIF